MRLPFEEHGRDLSMEELVKNVEEYLALLPGLIAQWLRTVATLLGDLGVPEIYREVGALGLLYLLVTLAVALFILLLLRIGRRKKPAPGPAPSPLSEVGEAGEEEAEEAPVTPVAAPAEVVTEAPLGLFERMRAGLAKTQNALVGRLDSLLSGRKKIDAELLDDLEEILIAADFGMRTTQDLIQSLRGRVDKSELSPAALRAALQDELRQRLRLEAAPLDLERAKPFVIMVVGVNGVGKTTTIGKLARQFAEQGKRVVLGAGDTFRAAAAEQLAIWGERAGVDVIRHNEGADPAAVAFDAAKAAVARNADVLILVTAGRLHT
jgi:fused signal recognition particle receptor